MARCLAAVPALLAAFFAASAPAQQVAAEAESPVICQVSGYDVVIVNRGATALAAGTGVAWSVRFARMEGIHLLESALAPGAIHVLTGALGSSYLGTRTPCEASIADPADQGGAADPR